MFKRVKIIDEKKNLHFIERGEISVLKGFVFRAKTNYLF